ncbi:MAG: hypothetical protein P8M65_11800 [Roseibacillus sp.]|nr:hypothetical protein [Roseibacillus sp.]
MEFSDGTSSQNHVGIESNSSGVPALTQKFTGLSSISLFADPDWRGDAKAMVTLKITSASEINAVTPSSVLVLPENSTGDFDVIIESSSDLVSWLPFFSQTVNSQTASRFFRTRVVRASVQPPVRPVEPVEPDRDTFFGPVGMLGSGDWF